MSLATVRVLIAEVIRTRIAARKAFHATDCLEVKADMEVIRKENIEFHSILRKEL